MSRREGGFPWGTLLVVLTLLYAGWQWRDWRRDSETFPTVPMVDPLVTRSTGWAPFKKAEITPGMQTLTRGGGQCTTNFVFSDAKGRLYIGQAAHCASDGKVLNGCKAKSQPLGTVVSLRRHVTPDDYGRRMATGRLAYSSWVTMQKRGEKHLPTCVYNDFALIALGKAARPRTNPSLPFWGGPTGLAERGVYATERVHSFGASSLRKEGSRYARQTGLSLEDRDVNAGWSHAFRALSPGIPGDSGSGYVDNAGRAIGTLSTLIVSTTLLNTLGDLRKELEYARRYSGIKGLRLELGTEPFNRDIAEAPLRDDPSLLTKTPSPTPSG